MFKNSAILFGRCHYQVRFLTQELPQHAHLTRCHASPKFFRKIMYISTLSELAQHVPLTQIDVPPAVYKYVWITKSCYSQLMHISRENLKFERKITLPVPMRSSTFGVPLEDLMGYNGEKGGVPRVVRDATQFLREMGTCSLEKVLYGTCPSNPNVSIRNAR